MTQVIRSTAGTPPKRADLTKPPPLQLTLPKEPSVPSANFNDYHLLACGMPGVGKTTLGAQEEGAFILSFDPIRKALRIMQRYVPDWKHFIGYLELMEKQVAAGTFGYTRVILDGCDLWFRACQRSCCIKLGIDHPADEGWGKGWDLVAQTFIDAVKRVMALPCGTWFICHSRVKERETRDGVKAEVLAPVLTGRAEDVLVGMCDMVLNIKYVGEERIGVILHSEDIVAKNNVEGHFLTPEGKQIREINMGSEGPAEAYRRLMLAFNNKQTYVQFTSPRPPAAAKPSPKPIGKPIARPISGKKGGG